MNAVDVIKKLFLLMSSWRRSVCWNTTAEGTHRAGVSVSVCLGWSVLLCSLCASAGSVPSPNAPLKRVLAYTGCFSRMGTIKDIHLYLSQRLRIKEEDMRLWLYNSEVGGSPGSPFYYYWFGFKKTIYSNFSFIQPFSTSILTVQ